jgi:hypothetical protein
LIRLRGAIAHHNLLFLALRRDPPNCCLDRVLQIGVALTDRKEASSMSLLRRLTEQAQQVKDAEAAQERARADHKDRFTQVTVPAMQALGAFLTELTDQLKVVRPPVQQNFDLPGYGVFPTQCLFDFAVRVDPRYSEIQLELTWKSRIDTERAPKLVLNSFDRIRNLSELFKRMHLGGFKDEKRGPGGHIIACTLQATGFVSSRMLVVATLEDEVARFTFENIDQLLVTRQSIPLSVFSDEVCERLGEFLLRDNDIFIRDQWVRGLSPPANPFRPSNMDERAVAPLNSAPPITTNQSGGPAALKIESGFSRASAQNQERDNELLAELSEASRMAEEVVKRNIDTTAFHEYSSERSSGSVLSSAAGLADMYRQADAIPSHSIASAAPAVATPRSSPVQPAPVVAATPAATPTPPPTPAPEAAAKSTPTAPLTRAAPTSSGAVVAAPAAAKPPATAPLVAPSAKPPLPVQVSAPTPRATPVPAAAPPSTPSAAPRASLQSTATPAPATPKVEVTPAVKPAAGPVEDAESQAQPAVARSFMDRFQKMRSELERKP